MNKYLFVEEEARGIVSIITQPLIGANFQGLEGYNESKANT